MMDKYSEEVAGCIMLFIALAIVLGTPCIWLAIEWIKDRWKR